MENFFKKLAATVLPYLGMVAFFIVFVIGLIFFSYLVIVAAIIGFILFAIAYIRTRYILRKQYRQPQAKQKGRTIDHQE